MVLLVGGSVFYVATGDHHPHAQSALRRFQRAAHPEDGITLGHAPFFSRIAVDGPSRCGTSIFCYKSVAISSQMRSASFLQVYRPSVRQCGKIGHHGSLV